jgi:glycosyltransferase involved in cell wall biosynthesis
MTTPTMRIAVLVPCFNEEAAVATVIAGFRKALPLAEIFVYDNNSSDCTIAVAREAGAQVRTERRQGKGHVVRRMFADIDADIYVLVDGDATYDAASAPRMIDALVTDRLDMVVGFRVDQTEAAYRRGHRTGNWMLSSFLSVVFGPAFRDILSGYRVFSRRFVKSFPVLSDGFEIETELSVHALELALPVPVGKAVAVFHGHRNFPDAGIDRPRDSDHHHLFRGRHRSSSPDRGSVHGPDDFGGAIGIIGTGARYGDARTPRNEAAGLFVSSPHKQELMRLKV